MRIRKIEVPPEMEEELKGMGAGDPDKEQMEEEIYGKED